MIKGNIGSSELTLDEWLAQQNWTDREMAEACSKHGIHCTRQAVQLWRKGDRRPGAEARYVIHLITGGAVTDEDLDRAFERRQARKKRMRRKDES